MTKSDNLMARRKAVVADGVGFFGNATVTHANNATPSLFIAILIG